MEEMKLEVIYMPAEELIPAEYNPKKCSPAEEESIRASIKRFGIVDPLIINVNPDRKNILVNGHQRFRIAKQMGYAEFPCVTVDLPLDKEKELNARLSIAHASIDEALLAINFSKEQIEEMGYKLQDMKAIQSDFEQQVNAITNADAAYPLVPKFSEKHDAVIIVSHNTTDTAFLETVLGIQKSQSYKNSRTGKAMVIDVDHFRKMWEKK